MINRDTRTCDNCGRRYEFTSYKDRCPFCCPEQKPDDYELDDWGDDLTAESDYSYVVSMSYC
jgi:endogenous inhibitor of DNA gyrase (YacG/DUF329 family)